MKKFLISIDTEGDNLWKWQEGQEITTANASYLQRFQEKCDLYGFKPTYLTNYEMASSAVFVDFAKKALKSGRCSVGMHLHAWNNPPAYTLANLLPSPAAPYLIEYPAEIMEEKIAYLTDYLANVFETPMLSHRAGRWAMNDIYFSLLEKYGYTVDCSVTPGIDWSNNKGATEGSRGSDYSLCPKKPYLLSRDKALIEVPVTVYKTNRFFVSDGKTPKEKAKQIYCGIKGRTVWLRPTGKNLNQMLWMVRKAAADQNTDYIMFMLHSSEFMPGGSPTFQTGEDIEVLYKHLDILFAEASDFFEGETIEDYAKGVKKSLKNEN